MKKLWSISTTLRNPERLRNFLMTLKEMESESWTKENQIKFQIKLIQNRVYGFGSAQFYNGLTQNQIALIDAAAKPISFEQAQEILYQKQYVDPAMRGRNSYKILEKIGLVFLITGKVKISSLGEYLLGSNYDLGELFFKSFLKWQYPNPVDKEFKDENVYNLKPFLLTLHLINEVNKICKTKNLTGKGISKPEFELFALTLLNQADLKTQATKLINFRLSLAKIKDHQKKKQFIDNYRCTNFTDFSNIKHSKDYTDNAIRYFRMTRFLYIRGGGYYIDLEPRRMVEINSLLNTHDGSSEIFTKNEYIEYISDINLPDLPWETKTELTKIYNKLTQSINDLESQLSIGISTFQTLTNINDLKIAIEKLRLDRLKLQNQILKNGLTKISKIDETIENLRNIRKLDLKPSIALEKHITIALNIVNDAINIKANAPVGDDNEFTFTAPANKADIECFYNSFNAICEVTMLVSREQWYNEGQPVMRHFRDFESDSKQISNYCLFVAPKMHRDTINTYWMSVKHGYEGTQQKIVPLTIDQIIKILEIVKSRRRNNENLTHLQFKVLLDNIIDLTNNIKKSEEWLRKIPNCISQWGNDIGVTA